MWVVFDTLVKGFKELLTKFVGLSASMAKVMDLYYITPNSNSIFYYT